MDRSPWISCLILSLLLAPTTEALADAVPIDVPLRGENRIRVDGVLGDWHRFTELTAIDDPGQVISGRATWHGPDDASVGFAFVRDDEVLYFAVEVRDDVVVRSRAHAPGDDAIVFSFGGPSGSHGTVGYDIVVYPGEPGAFAGAVRFRGAGNGAVTGAQVVEAPLRNGAGFTLEGTIPWRSLPPILAGIASARGRVAYEDNDGHGVETVLATAPGDGRHVSDLPPLSGSNANQNNDLIRQFRTALGLGDTEPLLDRTANVAGDAGLEHLVIFPGYIVAAGSGIAGGARYAYVQFPITTREDVLEPAMRDVTGDGRLDVVLRFRRHEVGGLTRDVVYVYAAPEGSDQLRQVFAIEAARAQGDREAVVHATYDNGGIRVTLDHTNGFTRANYPRAVESEVVPVLTAWGAHRMELYRWSDANHRFDLSRSEPNPDASVPATSASADPVGNPTPAAPSQAPPDGQAVLAAFRRQHAIADDARAAFSITANFAGDTTLETLQVFDRFAVLTGAHFMNGRSFYTMELPVTSGADILSLEAGDVTDDGHAEAIVHVRRAQQAQVHGQTLEATKEYVLVYSMDEAHRGRIFGAEIGRRVGGDAIANVVHTVPGGRNSEMVIDPGHASGGWDAQHYPFHDQPTGGFAPLLLPWETQRPVRYRWDGAALVRVP